jgi:hypothetical protein
VVVHLTCSEPNGVLFTGIPERKSIGLGLICDSDVTTKTNLDTYIMGLGGLKYVTHGVMISLHSTPIWGIAPIRNIPLIESITLEIMSQETSDGLLHESREETIDSASWIWIRLERYATVIYLGNN